MSDIQKTNKDKNSKLAKKEAQDVSDPLEKVKLDSQQIAGALVKATVGSITSSTPVFKKFFEGIERFDQAKREYKLKILRKEYSERFDSLDEATSQIKLLVATRGGQTLFRKIIQIIDKGDEDQEWISLLAIALKKVSETEFEKYFDSQMFILSQIDRLSPQALILLSEYDIWKQVKIDGTTTTSGQTMGDWIPKATKFVIQKKGIDNLEVGARINHSFRELESTGMVDLKGHQLKLAAIGLEIHRAITESVS